MSNPVDTAAILTRIIGPRDRDLSPEVARFFLGLSFTDEDDQRIADLSEKANEGELSAAEREELNTYVILGDFLTIVQSRAATLLGRVSAA